MCFWLILNLVDRINEGNRRAIRRVRGRRRRNGDKRNQCHYGGNDNNGSSSHHKMARGIPITSALCPFSIRQAANDGPCGMKQEQEQKIKKNGLLDEEEMCGNNERDGEETETDVEICGNSSCDSGSVAAMWMDTVSFMQQLLKKRTIFSCSCVDTIGQNNRFLKLCKTPIIDSRFYYLGVP